MGQELGWILVATIATTGSCALAATRYVDQSSTNPAAPYTNWVTAAHTIQEAVDVSLSGDEIVVTDGIYATGERTFQSHGNNRLVIDKPITVRSVNGPAVTILSAKTEGWPLRGVYLVDGAVLSGFSVCNGSVPDSPYGGGIYAASATAVITNCTVFNNVGGERGGGVRGGTLYDCTLRDNVAFLGGGAENCVLNRCILTANNAEEEGGGAMGSVLNQCTLSGNVALWGGGAGDCTLNNCVLFSNSATGSNSSGGGAVCSTLNNCVVVGNSAADYGGGVGMGPCPSTLNNCIIYFNAAPSGANFTPQDVLNYCCTTPLPTNGHGNITAEPKFVDQLHNDFHLQASSPCINTGNNALVFTQVDADGKPRIVGGTVDIDAYEYQTPVSQASYAWLQQFDLPLLSSTDKADTDEDGMNNWQEWVCGTIPTNAQSVLKLSGSECVSTGVKISWPSVLNRSYVVERCTNLTVAPFAPVSDSLVGTSETLSFTDTNRADAGACVYRLKVQQ